MAQTRARSSKVRPRSVWGLGVIGAAVLAAFGAPGCTGGELHLLEGTGGSGGSGGTAASSGGAGDTGGTGGTGGGLAATGATGGTGGVGSTGGTGGTFSGGSAGADSGCGGTGCDDSQCPHDSGCNGPPTGCPPDAHDCVACSSPADFCPQEKPYCHPVLYRCTECTTSPDCWGLYGGTRSVCWAGKCVPCQGSQDCPFGMACENGICGPCSGDESCPSGLICESGYCSPP
jgi:hypothetical protein